MTTTTMGECECRLCFLCCEGDRRSEISAKSGFSVFKADCGKLMRRWMGPYYMSVDVEEYLVIDVQVSFD